MSLAATVKAMAAAGLSAQQIADVVDRMEEERLVKSRAGNAKRQAAFRARHSNVNNALHSVTPVTGVTDPSPLLSSPAPPTNNPLPQSSLRSVSDRARVDELFERFWAVFPKRTNKKTARAKFEVALKAGVDPEKIISAAKLYAEHVKFTEPQFIKAPDAWLNAGKWDDEFPAEPQKPQARAGPQRSSGDGMTVVLQKLREQVNGQQSNGIKDISPTGVPEPGAGNAGSRVSEPVGKSSGGGEILDFRPASPDTRRSTAPHGEAARTFEWPDPSWEHR